MQLEFYNDHSDVNKDYTSKNYVQNGHKPKRPHDVVIRSANM